MRSMQSRGRRAADRTLRLNPLVTIRSFAGCGHAPPLLTADQTGPVVEFLCTEE